jgi:hypothetical protein
VCDELPRLKGKVNHKTSQAVFDQACHRVYEKIKARESITQTLEKHLIEEDVQSAFDTFVTLLKSSDQVYSFCLLTNLITFRGLEHLYIGEVQLRPIESAIVDWPESCGGKLVGASLLGSLLGASGKYPDKETLLKNNKDAVVLETRVSGCHFQDEPSLAFHVAVSAFKRVFAYLAVARFSLSEVASEKYEFETTEIPRNGGYTFGNPVPRQQYYALKVADQDFIRAINTEPKTILLTPRMFMLDPAAVEQLRDRCSLDNFNNLFTDEKRSGEIKDKVSRCFDWYLKADLETDLTDEMLSLFISLESLLSPGGGDPTMSHSDYIAENVAILVQSTVDERYQWKKTFKKRYQIRNKITHHGSILSADYWLELRNLRVDVVWSLMGVLSRLSAICRYGTGAAALKEYFEREKMK